jgi:hypothetical protein
LIKILSHGGGLDSFAMLVDAIGRGDLPDYAVFADTGHPGGRDGEWPGTYEHLKQYTIPLCQANGIEFVWITPEMYSIRGSSSLIEHIEKNRMMLGVVNRMCTIWAKVERIQEWMFDTFPPPQPIEVWIGFEANEEQRAAYDPNNGKTCGGGKGGKRNMERIVNRYPLIERKLCRCRCELLVRERGYPVPRKSACIYCPFNTKDDWRLVQDTHPVVFARAVSLEQNFKGTGAGKFIKFSGADDVPLEEFVMKPYKPRVIPCIVCGRPQRSRKLVGNDWVQPDEMVQP